MIRFQEHVALYGRYFGDALNLRRNHPRIIPEAALISDHVLSSLGLPPDAIVDEDSAASKRAIMVEAID